MPAQGGSRLRRGLRLCVEPLGRVRQGDWNANPRRVRLRDTENVPRRDVGGSMPADRDSGLRRSLRVYVVRTGSVCCRWFFVLVFFFLFLCWCRVCVRPF